MAPPAVTAIAPNTDPISNDLFLVTYESTGAHVYSATQQTLLSATPTMTLIATLPIAAKNYR